MLDYKDIDIESIYNLDLFKQYIGNEKWKNEINAPICSLQLHYGVIGEYNNINKYEEKLNGGKSQNGEDGLLNYIFNKIGTTNKYYVEFGAGDGEWLSNAYFFREQLGWTGLLLEGNSNEVNNCKKNINLHCEFITPNNINSLFKKYDVPKNFDLLSIDIDSYDYWVWKALDECTANVVIIETNAGLPNNIPLTAKMGEPTSTSSWYFGANLLAFYDLAKEKGYEFVTTVRFNAIFIKKELLYKLAIEPISREQCINNYFKPNNYSISLILSNKEKHPPWITY